MIFDEMVQEVCDRLNFTSDEAKARIARNLNTRYRRVTSGIGLEMSRRTQVSKAATIGSQFITFTGVEKIDSVIDKSTGMDQPLMEITVDEMHTADLHNAPPKEYAVYSTTATTITIQIDVVAATAFLLYADALASTTTLSGSQSPAFPESYHDILIYGAMADEYRKMEKLQFARDAEADYDKRVAELRQFIAQSAYMDIYQGKETSKLNWWRDKFTGGS